jgi:hypothetical protein
LTGETAQPQRCIGAAAALNAVQIAELLGRRRLKKG